MCLLGGRFGLPLWHIVVRAYAFAQLSPFLLWDSLARNEAREVEHGMLVYFICGLSYGEHVMSLFRWPNVASWAAFDSKRFLRIKFAVNRFLVWPLDETLLAKLTSLNLILSLKSLMLFSTSLRSCVTAVKSLHYARQRRKCRSFISGLIWWP